jgi:hypothetical protein
VLSHLVTTSHIGIEQFQYGYSMILDVLTMKQISDFRLHLKM